MRHRALGTSRHRRAARCSPSPAGCGSSGSSGTGGADEVQRGRRRRPGLRAGAPATSWSSSTTTRSCRPSTTSSRRSTRRRRRQPLLDALNKVSAALTTDKLVALNKADRHRPQDLAERRQGVRRGQGPHHGRHRRLRARSSVGAANFTENQTLANIYADVLNAAGFDASVKTVGNRELYQPALEKGEIQVVPEYVGTLTEFINKARTAPTPRRSPAATSTRPSAALTGLGDKVGLKFGEPGRGRRPERLRRDQGVRRQVRREDAVRPRRKCSSGLVLGGPPECPDRPFCQPGLERQVRPAFDSFSALDAGGPLTKTALKKGKVALGLVFSSDAALASWPDSGSSASAGVAGDSVGRRARGPR